MLENQESEQASSQQGVYKYIELILQWRGKLNTRDLMDQLGISRQSASKAITSYKRRYPDALSYNTQTKEYNPTERFVLEHSTGSFQEYISLFHGESSVSLPTSFMSAMHRQPSPDVVRPILKAIENNLRLDVSYASISSPEFQERIISPHSLIHDGNRWHVRAWCEKNRDYRDFVLTRIKEVFGEEGYSQANRFGDTGWNTWVNLCIKPDPRLSKAKQNIVAMDYGMVSARNGQLKRSYQVRGALVIYWIQQLRLDRYCDHPEAQQIVLSEESRPDIEKWTS